MSASNKDGSSRRQFLGATTLATAFASLAGPGLATTSSERGPDTSENEFPEDVEPFFGTHQSGIVTPSQTHTYFAAFDLITTKQSAVAKLLQAWTEAAARMTAGEPAQDISSVFAPAQTLASAAIGTLNAAATDNDGPPGSTGGTVSGDTGEALDLSPARLTLTFGFGASLFLDNGKDRFGFSSLKPDALSDLPSFPGDQLDPAWMGGDISVQACADDQQVAFHAVRQLARIADGIAQIRWAQVGFLPSNSSSDSPRNLLGFRDGTNNPPVEPVTMNKIVWVGDEGPAWLRDGSYLVARRIRIDLRHWDRTTVEVQESTIGRRKISGAPLGKAREHDPLDLAAADKDGNPVIPETAHVRLAAADTNDGAKIWRRPYSYNDSVNFIAERGPQGLEYDAGLFFVCYQRDPRTGFIKINERLSRFDMMNQFITHVGSSLFACPRGLTKGEFVGQELFESV